MLNFLSLEVLHPDSGQRPCQGGIQMANELSFLRGCLWGRKQRRRAILKSQFLS